MQQKDYVIQKLINNNVVFSLDENGNEIILFGKAIGFNKKRGDRIAAAAVIKRFEMADPNQKNYLTNLVETIQPVYIDLAAKIISLFEENLDIKVNDMMIISLSDHLSNAVANKQEGFEVPLDILTEIKNVYPKEFRIATEALGLVEQELSVSLGEDEAGYIVLHYLNSAGSQYRSDAKERLLFQERMIDVIEGFYSCHLDRSTLYYTRFLTHLSFLYSRLHTEGALSGSGFTVYDILQKEYPRLCDCVEQCAQTIERCFATTVNEEEKGYLAIHIKNMLQAMKKEGTEDEGSDR